MRLRVFIGSHAILKPYRHNKRRNGRLQDTYASKGVLTRKPTLQET